MNSSFIRIEKKERVASVTLSRTEKKNALNDQLVSELTHAFTSLEEDLEVKVIILKADGDVFSAGADLEYLQKLRDFSYEQNLADSNSLKELFLKIYNNKKLIIAQVEGHAIAGGCGLVTVCDFCFAVPEAKFGYTEARIGFIPALVSVFLLRKIKEADLRELLFTGKLISALKAKEIGLINGVIEKDEINGYISEFSASLCNEVSAESIAATKELLSGVYGLKLTEALTLAAKMNAHARSGTDCKKGIDAFLKKENIRW